MRTRGSAARESGRRGALVRSIASLAVAGVGLLQLTGCAAVSPHQFAEPANDWQVRTGQLLYRTATTSLIGDVLVRYSKGGDFELRFSKGPGAPLLVLRQDAEFANVSGAFAGKGWTGPVDRAPTQLRGWLELREAVLHAQNKKSISYSTNSEKFEFRF